MVSMVIMDRTTIQLSNKTKDALAALGKKDDTFDDIVNRLIDFYSERKP